MTKVSYIDYLRAFSCEFIVHPRNENNELVISNELALAMASHLDEIANYIERIEKPTKEPSWLERNILHRPRLHTK